ncbi:MAG: hypothetical protein O2954_21325, partial [bacterium]|nr:hypothetical protein [bacterium]
MAKIPRDERAVTDQDFFQALDPKRRDLTPMRNAAKNGNMEEARRLAVEHFRTRTNPKWFFDMRSKCRGKVPAAWPGLDTGALHRADSLLRNRFLLRGNNEALAFNSGKNLKWRTAEMRQLASTAYALKRGNFFRDLAIAYAHTGRTDYAEKFTYLLERWQADWPLVVDDDFHPKTAVLARSDGHDTMTTAFRWFSWMDCLYSGILFTPQVPSEAAFRLIRSLWFTALQYRTYETSPYVPANHHLFERGTSPFLFGVMLPEFPEVARLVQQAAPVIEKHTEHSFLPDGGYEERTTSYTTSALNMFFIPLRLAARNRMPLLSRASRTRLKRCGEMVALL